MNTEKLKEHLQNNWYEFEINYFEDVPPADETRFIYRLPTWATDHISKIMGGPVETSLEWFKQFDCNVNKMKNGLIEISIEI